MLKRIAIAGWLGLEYGWYPLLVFLTTPYFLAKLGVENYGHWMLLNSFVGLGVILNAGTSVAVIKQMSEQIGRAAHADVQNTFRSSLAIAIGGGGVLATLILLLVGVFGGVIFNKMGSNSAIHMMAVTAAVLIWIEQIDNVGSSALKGAERFGISARVEVLAKTVQVGLALLTVIYVGSLTALYIALIITAVARLALKLLIIRSALGIRNVKPSFKGVGSVLLMARWGWLQGVGSILFGITDRFLVGSILGATSLAHYSLASQLAQQSHGLTAAIMSSVFPVVSRRLAADSTSSLKRIYRYSIASSLLISGVIVTILLTLGDRILVLWLGHNTAASVSPILKILTVAYGVLALNISPNYLLLGMGKIREVAIINLASGCVMLGCMVFLVQPYGIQGVGIARILYGLVAAGALIFIFHSNAVGTDTRCKSTNKF